MGFFWVNGFSFFHCVASPFHSFVTTLANRHTCTRTHDPGVEDLRLTRTDLVDGFTSPSAVDTKVVFEVWARARSDRSRWALTSTSCAPDAKAACSSLAVDTTVISASASALAAGLSMPAFESCRAVREGSRSCPLASSPNCTHHDHHMTDLVVYRLG